MIPFGIQVTGYQSLMKTLKGLVKTLPFPKPTLFSGPGSSLQLCEAISQMGVRKLLIVTDSMLVKIGLLDDIESKLEDLGVRYAIYDGILPDPTVDQIEAGLKVLKRERCQAILAVGGGSPIDAAKVIAARATNDKSISRMEGMFKIFTAPMPLYAVPTTAGTGSEVTIAAVVSDPKKKKKSPIMDPKLVPMMAALDGALMTGLPPHITAATGMDALTHAVEAYLSANALPETDGYALAATKLIMENLPRAVAKGKDLKARQAMSFASYYAALAFTRAGVGYVHAISHNFGAFYHTPHGLANAIVMPYVLDFSKRSCTRKLSKLADVSGLRQKGDRPQKLASRFIDHIRELNEEFGIPDRLEALERSDIPAIARNALKEAHYTYAVPRYMDQRTCERLIGKMLA
ncbi:MAG: iron-containing alcohol dehydrogenase [Gammaproteobacteria bacterium]|nr:MAG: iron-containing alcohol dehydrogenase [Gammaproteobacteria bacterium]